MAPHATEQTVPLARDRSTLPKLVAPQADDWKFKVSYKTVAAFCYFHLSAVYGLYLCSSAHWATIILALVLLEAGMLGLMAGAHRLWAHRSYKAKLPLQIILMLFHSLANQYTALNWARDHRLHHRHSDTDADPHNATRGFFFSHVGWLLVYKHPEVRRRGASTEISDLLSNPVLMFQKNSKFVWSPIFNNVVTSPYKLYAVTQIMGYKYPVIILTAYVLPTIIPMYFWGETFINSWHINLLRSTLCLNFVSLINSAAHAFGKRPYDKEIKATENMTVNLATLGEGFHNYHHAFPWDYRAAESAVSRFNMTAAFIDFFAWIGWAYDLKTVEHGMVVRRAKKSGDGTYWGAELDDFAKNA